MINNSFNEIAQAMKKAEKIAVFPHILMDGDALGSAAALCRALRMLGKDAAVLIEDKIPDFLSFLDNGYCTYDIEKYRNADICLCIDCGEPDRFPGRADIFESGKLKICIDHHSTSPGIGDLNYIDGKAAAAGELVFDLLKEMDAAIDKETAEAIFTAINTDTGNFQYSNTTKKSHQIVCELYDHGIDAYKVSVALYENESFEKIRLMSAVLNNSTIFAGGKAISACISQELLKEYGARMEDTEGIVSVMRSIKGIDIAALIKEKEKNSIKVSLRAKEGSVSPVAVAFGGGGHDKAAGCTIHDDLRTAEKMIKESIEKTIEAEKCRDC